MAHFCSALGMLAESPIEVWGGFTICLFNTNPLLQSLSKLMATGCEQLGLDALINHIDETRESTLVIAPDVLSSDQPTSAANKIGRFHTNRQRPQLLNEGVGA